MGPQRTGARASLQRLAGSQLRRSPQACAHASWLRLCWITLSPQPCRPWCPAPKPSWAMPAGDAGCTYLQYGGQSSGIYVNTTDQPYMVRLCPCLATCVHAAPNLASPWARHHQALLTAVHGALDGSPAEPALHAGGWQRQNQGPVLPPVRGRQLLHALHCDQHGCALVLAVGAQTVHSLWVPATHACCRHGMPVAPAAAAAAAGVMAALAHQVLGQPSTAA